MATGINDDDGCSYSDFGSLGGRRLYKNVSLTGSKDHGDAPGVTVVVAVQDFLFGIPFRISWPAVGESFRINRLGDEHNIDRFTQPLDLAILRLERAWRPARGQGIDLIWKLSPAGGRGPMVALSSLYFSWE
jgi:hypothetical protein